MRARFVCALPAQVALHILDLPDWKREVLSDTPYARRVVMPVQILPPGQPHYEMPETLVRPNTVYECYGHTHRVPESREELQTAGGCINGELYDRLARPVWDDPDHTILTGAGRRVAFRFPEFAGRIKPIGVRRWRYGIPRFYPGKIGKLGAATAPAGRIHFCGDYCGELPASMEAASRSGASAASEVLATT